MITVKQAKKLIARNCPKPKVEGLSLSEALGCVLAEDIRSPLPLPNHDNSAMDGFVLRQRATVKATTENPVYLNIKGVIKAGDFVKRPLQMNESYRIMTGAAVLKGGDVVLPVEDAEVEQNQLVITKPLGKGRHIRYQGEEIQKGDKVIEKGTLLSPGVIGFLASLGKDKLKIYPKPSVAVIATGSELVAPGKKLSPGKIYDSNSILVSSLVKEMGINPSSVKRIGDNPRQLRQVIRRVLNKSEVLILTGGVSVGDYDYVKDILEEFGVKKIFWKVRQKPGKPIYFGKTKRTLVFGLPGNPASVFTCFYEYVYPALGRMRGRAELSLLEEKVNLGMEIKPDRSKVQFLKGKVSANGAGKAVESLRHQGSHMLSSLCQSNCLIVVEPGEHNLRKGESVVIHHLPN